MPAEEPAEEFTGGVAPRWHGRVPRDKVRRLVFYDLIELSCVDNQIGWFAVKQSHATSGRDSPAFTGGELYDLGEFLNRSRSYCRG